MNGMSSTMSERVAAGPLRLEKGRLWVLGAALAALPFSESRVLEYQFFGPHALSAFQALLMLYLVLLLADWRRCVGVLVGRHRIAFGVICAPLVVFLVGLALSPSSETVVRIHSFATAVSYMVVILMALMLMDWDSLGRRLVAYLCGMMSVMTIPVIGAMLPWWEHISPPLFALNFSFPFMYPSQAGFFMITSMFFLAGALLSDMVRANLHLKSLAIISALALTELAVAMTGSRTCQVSFIALVALYSAGYLLWWRVGRVHVPVRLAVVSPLVLALGLALGAVPVTSYFFNVDEVRKAQVMRIQAGNLMDLVSVRADPPRHAMWAGALRNLSDGKWMQSAPRIKGFDRASMIGSGSSVHSVYIDLYVYAGPFAALVFVLFLAGVLALSIKQAYLSWRSPLFPLYWACVMVVIEIIVFLYTQPAEYLALIWVVLAVILCFLVRWPEQSAGEIRPRAG
jgi:hypothetical protein